MTREKSPRLGRFSSPAPEGFLLAFMGVLGGGEAKGRAPAWLHAGTATSEIKSGVATSLCLSPGARLMEHEFGSHPTKPGATGAALGGPDGLPQEGLG